MRVRQLLVTAAMLGSAGGYIWSSLPPAAGQSPQERERIEHSVYYANCKEVRAAGKAPLYAGQPGYREGMDADGDGVACEPYRGGG